MESCDTRLLSRNTSPSLMRLWLILSSIWHAVVSFVTLKNQMSASVPSFLHAIRLKLDANLEILQTLSKTWPIARFLVELFNTMSTPEQFSRLLTAAVEECQKRARGDFDSPGTGPRSSGPFRRPKIQQVVLPQSRVVLQILARESQRRQSPLPQLPRMDTATGPSDCRPENIPQEGVDGLAATIEDCEPTAILRNLQKIIDVGKSAAHRADE